MTSEAELFDTHFPYLDEKQTFDTLDREGFVVSMIGKRATPNVFLVKFATEKKSYLPLILTETVATALRRVLTEEGF